MTTKEHRDLRVAERKRQALELLGGMCVKCGISEGLQFDHINPTTKLYAIGTRYDSAWETLKTEVMKCQLLCLKHHQEKTRIEHAARALANFQHGTPSGYNNRHCRCDDCRESWAKYVTGRKHSAKIDSAPVDRGTTTVTSCCVTH